MNSPHRLPKAPDLGARWFAVLLMGASATGAVAGTQPNDPACSASTVTSEQMTSMGRVIHVDTWPAGVEIDARRLPLFDDNKDGKLDTRDARFRDSIGFRTDPRSPVRPPSELGIRRVYLSSRGASLDREGKRPTKIYARSCFGMAQLVAPKRPPRR